MRRLWAIAILFISAAAQAAGPSVPPAVPYDRLYDDSKLDVTIALGFSEVNGHDAATPSMIPIVAPLINQLNAGKEDVANRIADVHSIQDALLGCSECRLTQTQSGPGFNIYTASIVRNGHPVAVRVRFIHPDTGVKPETLRDWYRAAAASDDVVIYAGHSRHGRGAPDFGPSSLTSGKVFYEQPGGHEWYGFDRTPFAKNKYQLVAMLACKTERYYEQVLRAHVQKPATDLGLILTNENSYWDDYPANSATLVRGLVLGESGDQILHELEDSSRAYQVARIMNPELSPNLYQASGPQIEADVRDAKTTAPDTALAADAPAQNSASSFAASPAR